MRPLLKAAQLQITLFTFCWSFGHLSVLSFLIRNWFLMMTTISQLQRMYKLESYQTILNAMDSNGYWIIMINQVIYWQCWCWNKEGVFCITQGTQLLQSLTCTKCYEHQTEMYSVLCLSLSQYSLRKLHWCWHKQRVEFMCRIAAGCGVHLLMIDQELFQED